MYFFENNIYIGIFRYYDSRTKTNPYYNKIKVLLSYSYNGINFFIISKQIFKKDYTRDLVINNFKKEGNDNIFFYNKYGQ